jgi:hypothetical protein
MKNLNKNSILLGIKKGYNTPILPEKLNKFYNLLIIRVSRVIGGICLLIILLEKFNLFPEYFQYLIFFIGLTHLLSIIIIFLIKIFFGIYKLIYHSNEFEVRNSPLNQLATQIGKILYCVKKGCAITGGGAAVIAAGTSFDSVLEAAGRDKIFIPMLGEGYKHIFGENLKSKFESETTIPNADDKDRVDKAIKSYLKLNDKEKIDYWGEISKQIEQNKQK